MKKFVLLTLLIFLFLPINASCIEAEGIEKILDMSGDFRELGEDAAGSELNFNAVASYIKTAFTGEFKTILQKITVLFLFLILFSIKNCLNMETSINKTVHLALFSAVALSSAVIMTDLIFVSKNMISELSKYIYICIPLLCGLMAGGGFVLTSAKASFIILSSTNIVTFLINCFFMPAAQIYFILSIVSALLENDILSSLKNNIKSIVKVCLPSLIGLFTVLLTLFVSVSKKMDDFTIKSAKTAVGNLVPFLGSALADSTEVVLTSIGQIKAQTGIVSVLAMTYIFVIPMLKMLAGILAFKFLSISAGLLTDKTMTAYYDDLSAVLSMLAGMMAVIAVIIIISVVTLINH